MTKAAAHWMAFGIGVAIALSGAYYHFATPVASAKQASPPTVLSPVVLQAYFRFAEERLYAVMEACIAIANAREMYPLTQDGDEFKTIEMKTDQVLRDALRNSGLSDEQAKTLTEAQEAVEDYRLAHSEGLEADSNLIAAVNKELTKARARYGGLIVDAMLKSTVELNKLDSLKAALGNRCSNFMD